LIEVSSSGLEIAFGSFDRPVLAGCHAHRHQGSTGPIHHAAHVREVQIDQTRRQNKIGDAMDSLIQRFIRQAEGVTHAHALRRDLEQSIIGDHNR
jgi:hypothetical protein